MLKFNFNLIISKYLNLEIIYFSPPAVILRKKWHPL